MIAWKNNKTFNLDKCHFSKNQIKFLYNETSKRRIKLTYEKVQGILEKPEPIDKKCLLGISTYISENIKKFSYLAIAST